MNNEFVIVDTDVPPTAKVDVDDPVKDPFAAVSGFVITPFKVKALPFKFMLPLLCTNGPDTVKSLVKVSVCAERLYVNAPNAVGEVVCKEFVIAPVPSILKDEVEVVINIPLAEVAGNVTALFKVNKDVPIVIVPLV